MGAEPLVTVTLCVLNLYSNVSYTAGAASLFFATLRVLHLSFGDTAGATSLFLATLLVLHLSFGDTAGATSLCLATLRVLNLSLGDTVGAAHLSWRHCGAAPLFLATLRVPHLSLTACAAKLGNVHCKVVQKLVHLVHPTVNLCKSGHDVRL